MRCFVVKLLLLYVLVAFVAVPCRGCAAHHFPVGFGRFNGTSVFYVALAYVACILACNGILS